MMLESPQEQHKWFEKLVGKWTFTSKADMGPDQPPMEGAGSSTVRSVGGMWLMAESESSTPDGGSWNSVMTLGYDTKRQRYVGTFVGSMSSYLWNYAGSLDASGQSLVLDTEGPAFQGEGMVNYQDIVQIVSDDHWILKSQLQDEAGNWKPFMEMHHHRVS